MIILNFKRIFPLILTVSILFGTIAVSSLKKSNSSVIAENRVKSTVTDKSAISTLDTPSNSEEMRGVWITYMELSMENEKDKSGKRFREKFDEMAQNCKEFGFNTLIVQVRPFCDAIYKSDYFPWSHILTGTQGKNPEYDALEIICEICKEKDLKIHAWINPYRISTGKTPSELCNDNPYQKDNSLGIETDSGTILDPSNEESRKLIINGVTEIIENYDVDGIQFDDYFYPTDIEKSDNSQYETYVNSVGENNCMSIDNWRKANVNMLVCETYRAVHNTDKNVVFGISPQGNIDNNDKLYADVKTWCSCKGFIDYICPQIYFSLDNPALSFEQSLESWNSFEYAEGVELYVGLAGYKAGTDDDEGTWLNDNNILAQEYNIIKNDKTSKGFMFYSYISLNKDDAKYETENLKRALY